MRKVEAPSTTAKERMIEMSRTELERFLSDLLDPASARATLGKVVASTEDLAQAYQTRFGAKTTTTAVGKALIKLGLPSSERRRLQLPRGNRMWVQALADRDHWRTQDNAAWVAEYLRGAPRHV